MQKVGRFLIDFCILPESSDISKAPEYLKKKLLTSKKLNRFSSAAGCIQFNVDLFRGVVENRKNEELFITSNIGNFTTGDDP